MKISIPELRRQIIAWYDEESRILPWRSETATPWGVMVSEFMLQQTPVIRVLPMWQQWMRRWPTPAMLAQDPSGEAVRAWGRLGYPRRALRLHAAAVEITEKFDGVVPSSYDQLLSLPGVGTYTAAAISSFAFKRKACVVDTNIRRVEARLISGQALPAPSLTKAETELAESLLPTSGAAAAKWNVAVMELGALVCTARAPDCTQCPVRRSCAWIAAGRPPATYKPKGQAWHGTDRQVRGAILAVLRHAQDPLPREFLGTEPIVADLIFEPLLKLRKLQAPLEQISRSVDGLLKDGLAVEERAGLRLP